MESYENGGAESQVLPPTSVDVSALSRTVGGGATSGTMLSTAVTSPQETNIDDDGHKTSTLSTPSSDSELQSTSIATSSLSFFSKSTMSRPREEEGMPVHDGKAGTAPLTSTPTKQQRSVSLLSPAAASGDDVARSTIPPMSLVAPPPGAPLSPSAAAAGVELPVTPTTDARSTGGVADIEGQTRVGPLDLFTTPQSAESIIEAPMAASSPSVTGRTDESSASVAALVHAASNVNECAADGDFGQGAREVDGGEGIGLSGAIGGDSGAERVDDRVGTPVKGEGVPLSAHEYSSSISTKEPWPRPSAFVIEGKRSPEGPPEVPSGSLPVLLAALDPFSGDSSEGQPRSSEHLGGTDDKGSDRIEGEAIVDGASDVSDVGSSPHLCRTQRSETTSGTDDRSHRGSLAEEDGAVHEQYGRLEQFSGDSLHQGIHELGKENSSPSPRPAAILVSHDTSAPQYDTCGPFIAVLGSKPISAAGVGLPESTQVHRVSMQVATPASSPIVMDQRLSIHTVDVPSPQSSFWHPSLPPASHSGHAASEEVGVCVQKPKAALPGSLSIENDGDLRGSGTGGWPETIFTTSEDDTEGSVAPEYGASRSSTQAGQHHVQKKYTPAKGAVTGKSAIVPCAGDVHRRLSLPPVAPMREVINVAGAPPLLRAQEHSGSTTTSVLPPAISKLSPAAKILGATRGESTPTAEVFAADSTVVQSTLAHVFSDSLLESPALQQQDLLTSPRQPLPPPPPPPSSSSPLHPPLSTLSALLSVTRNTERADALAGSHQNLPHLVSRGDVSTQPLSSAREVEEGRAAADVATIRGDHDASSVGARSTLGVAVESPAVLVTSHPSSSVQSTPHVPVRMAKPNTAGPLHDIYPLCTGLFTPVDRAIGASDVMEGDDISETLKSSTRMDNFSNVGMICSVISGKNSLSMAKFEACRGSSKSWHNDDVGTEGSSSSSSSSMSEGQGIAESCSESNHYEGYSDSSMWYSYDYSYSSISKGGTNDTLGGFRSSSSVVAPPSYDRRRGAATMLAPAASFPELVHITAYEEVPPVVGGGGSVLHWLRCGRKMVPGRGRTTRTEIHTVSGTVGGGHCGGSSVELSLVSAARRTGSPEHEDSVYSLAVPTQDARTHIAVDPKDSEEGSKGLGDATATGAVASDSALLTRDVGSVTEAPHHSDECCDEGFTESVADTPNDVDFQSKGSSALNGEAHLCEHIEIPAQLLEGSEKADKGSSGASAADSPESPPATSVCVSVASDSGASTHGKASEEGGAEETEEGAGVTVARNSANFYSMQSEALAPLFSWDSEPPCATCSERPREAQMAEEMKAKYNREVIAADEDAERVLCQAVRELMVHPPRQCIFVAVQGLRQWCSVLFCAQGGSGKSLETPAAFALSDEPHGRREYSSKTNAPDIEDPEWIDVRLAVYTHDGVGERLVAAGSVFSLPSNLKALQRCAGCTDVGDTAGYRSMCGYGRDSWSDLLVFQPPEVMTQSAAEGEHHVEGNADAGSGGATSEYMIKHHSERHRNDGFAARTHQSSKCEVEDVSSLIPLCGQGALYVKLEQRADRWVPIVDECACVGEGNAVPGGSSMEIRTQASFSDVQQTAVTPALGGGTPVHLATMSQPDDGDASESSLEWQTESSSSTSVVFEAVSSPSLVSEQSSTHDAMQHTSKGEAAGVGSHHAPTAPASGADGRAAATGTRLEEGWRPLAVSPPLLPADLCQLVSGQPSLATTLETTGEAALAAAVCVGQTLPLLVCRMRWAQEPQPSSARGLQSSPFELPASEALSSWEALGTAIEEYERVCRCAGPSAESVGTANSTFGGSVARQTGHGPLTVLWSTISSPLREADKIQNRGGVCSTAAPLQCCGRAGLSPLGRTSETLKVCSVVVRCATALLLAHEVTDIPGSRYCPPTSISVTGGCGGVLIERVAPVGGGGDAHGTPVASRAPIIQYDNLHFHAVLTRSTASSLLFNVHSVASPAQVFGFAVWTPFPSPSAADGWCSGDVEASEGLSDVWLPLFAPAGADARLQAGVPTQRQEGQLPGIPSGSGQHHPVHGTTGLLHVGWLHCDVEVMFLPSLAELVAHQLWNGPRRSLSSLAMAAVREAECGEGLTGHDIHVNDNALVDLTVVRVAGLRPLATQLGMQVFPKPLLWDDPSTWGNDTTCTHVYCELLALGHEQQQRSHRRAPRSTSPASEVAAASTAGGLPSGHLLCGDSPRGSTHSSLTGHVPLRPASWNSQGKGSIFLCGGRDQGTVRGGHDTETEASLSGMAANAALPITASVAHTNSPSWEHTFRIGLASFSSLHLRVFDVCQHPSDDNRVDSPGATPRVTGSGHIRGQRTRTCGKGVVLLGTTTVSHWLLRSFGNHPYGEGCTWLPLLWNPRLATRSVDSFAVAPGKRCLRPRSSLAVCNGFVLVKWRCLPRGVSMVRSPSTRSLGPWYASVTRRLDNSSVVHTTGSAILASSSCVTVKCLHEAPQRWYRPDPPPERKMDSVTAVAIANSQQHGWLGRDVVPWMQIRNVRLRWVWLQHFIQMHGGQVRLFLLIPTAQGETRLLAQCLLVPLCDLEKHSTGTVRGCRPSRALSRQRCDAVGVYGIVLPATSPSGVVLSPNGGTPAEAVLCLPARPLLEVQLWWYPRKGMGIPASGASDKSPRFIGRGEWRIPPEGVDTQRRGSLAKTEGEGLSWAANAHPAGRGGARLAYGGGKRGGRSTAGLAPLPINLREFFTLHESDLHISPVYSTGLPQTAEGGVLTWRLMSVPRLVCDGWGETHAEVESPPPQSAAGVSDSCGKSDAQCQPSPPARPSSTWVLPDVGTPTTVHVEVCDIVIFDRTDSPPTDAAQSTAALQVVVSGTPCSRSTVGEASEATPTMNEATCWMNPGEAPPPDAPRVPYIFPSAADFPVLQADAWVNAGCDQPAQHTPPNSQISRGLRAPLQNTQANALGVDGKTGPMCGSMPGAAMSRASPVEVQWPPRRFAWISDTPPSLSLWLVTPAACPQDVEPVDATTATGTGAKERVWGAVRLPRMDAFPRNSGMLWLPLFESYALPAPVGVVPRSAATAEKVTVNTRIGVNTAGHEGPHLTLAPSAIGGEDSGARAVQPSRVSAVVKHIGFASILYAHNMQRRSAAVAPSDNTPPDAATPRVLLVRVGRLRQRSSACAVERPPLSSSSSSSSSLLCESHTPSSDPALVHRATAGVAVGDAASHASAAAATDVLSADSSGVPCVLLGFGEHQVSITMPNSGHHLDGWSQASVTDRIAVFPLPRRNSGAGGSHELRVQVRVGASARMATNTLRLDLVGNSDGKETQGEAQWVPLVVRRCFRHNARVAGYDSCGLSVEAEILLQWRVVNLAIESPSRLGSPPVSLQQLVREYVGGGRCTSCIYTVFSAPTVVGLPCHNSPRHTRANAQTWASCLEFPEGGSGELDRLTPETVSRGLSRVLRMIRPRRHHCVYLILDQLRLQFTARQWMMSAASQRGAASVPHSVLAGDQQDGATSALIRLRLEVQLRWPAEWSTVLQRTALGSPPLSPKAMEASVAPDVAAAAFPAGATPATADTDSINVWIDSAEGAVRGGDTLAAFASDESAAGASGERLQSCTPFTALCLVLPSAQAVWCVLGEKGLAARFSLTFSLFALPPRRGSHGPSSCSSTPAETCIYTGRTPLVFPRSVQFGLTSLLSYCDSSDGVSAGAVASAADADTTDDASRMPVLLSWRARVAEFLPVPLKASSRSCRSPKVEMPQIGSGVATGGEAARRGGHVLSGALSSTSSCVEDEAIEIDRDTEPAGSTTATLMPRTPALARVTVSRIEFCGVDISLAHGADQRHQRLLPPATVTVAAADERGDAVPAASLPHQLMPRLVFRHPTVSTAAIPCTSPLSIPGEQVAQAPSLLPPPPPLQQRYVWSTDISLVAPVSKLIFHVVMPDAALRSARAEETWLPPRSSSSETGQKDTDAQSEDTLWQRRHSAPVDVNGKAAFTLDLRARMEATRMSYGGEIAAATPTYYDTCDVMLEVESLSSGSWLGRLWARVDITSADQLMRNAASVFLCSHMALSVRSCSGFVVGDVQLTCRAEEIYGRLRDRAVQLVQQRGKIPRRLRQQVREIRQIRRQLHRMQGLRHNGVFADHSTSSTAGVMRLTLASAETSTDSPPTFTSKPFPLPSAMEHIYPERGTARSSSVTHAPLMRVSHPVPIPRQTHNETATVLLELCQASSGVVVAAGQMTLPLYPTHASWREGASQPPASKVTSPLSFRVPLEPCTVTETPVPCIHPVAPSAGAVDVTSTWSLSPARGDTWLTCIYVKPKAGCDGEAKMHRRLLLRWIYCFEATAYPETEHAVDMSLNVRPTSVVTEDGEKYVGYRRGRHRPMDDASLYWSGRAMQLPRIGTVGATIKRVELVEVTPISCAHLSSGGEGREGVQASTLPLSTPTQDACVMSQLGTHVWSVVDELSFERKRLQAQKSGEDALMWLTCEGVSAAGNHRTRCVYEVLLGLSSSSSLGRCVEQLWKQPGLQATGVGKLAGSSESAAHQRQLHPCASATPLVACEGSPLDRAVDSSSRLAVVPLYSPVSLGSASGDGGGVVMRGLVFRCGSAPFATSTLGHIHAVTCRVVVVKSRGGRGAAVAAHQQPGEGGENEASGSAEASNVVLDAGVATSLLQERRPTEDFPDVPTVSPPFRSTQLSAVWSPMVGSLHSAVLAPCVAVASQVLDVHHQAQEGRPRKVEAGLLRVVLPFAQPTRLFLPTGDEMADGIASHSDVEIRQWREAYFRIEVAVRGRPGGSDFDETELTGRYVSTPFGVSDIFRSSQSDDCSSSLGNGAERKTWEAGGGDDLLSRSSLCWSSRLSMHLVATPAADAASNTTTRDSRGEERATGPVALQLSPTAVVEVTWSLDLLSLLQVRARASGVVVASTRCNPCSLSRNKGHRIGYLHVAADSFAGAMGGSNDDAADASSDETEMRQVEAYSAWSDILSTQKRVEETRMLQARLQRWRCTIVGIEVKGLELPSWRCPDVDTEDGIYDAGQHASLLAELVLPLGAPNTATDGVDARREPRHGGGRMGRHHPRCKRNKSGIVVGVARTTVSPIDGSARLDTDAPPTCGDGGFGLDVMVGARSVSTTASTFGAASPRPWRRRYTATFQPLSWSMAVTDMIDQATAPTTSATAENTEEGTATGTVGGAPTAGFALWHLLAPLPSASSSAENEIGSSQVVSEDRRRMVYGLGATQLSRLLGEGALYLVETLSRWCGDAYTTEERDALLRAAALYPTQWMPLSLGTPNLVGTPCDAQVRFKYAYSYHGPVLSLSKGLPTVVSSSVAASRDLTDTVFCAQLDRVKLTYTRAGDEETGALGAAPLLHSSTSTVPAWISRLTLMMRVCITTESAVDRGSARSRIVAQWSTRLAPMPCGVTAPITEASVGSGTVDPAAPATSSAKLLPPQPRTASVAMPGPPSNAVPFAVPMPVPIQSSEEEDVGNANRERSAAASILAPSSVAVVVPLLPTTRSFCWPSPRMPEATDICNVNGSPTDVPRAGVAETATTSVEMFLLLPVSDAEGNLTGPEGYQEQVFVDRDGAVAGTVVGRGQVCLGSSHSNGVVWDMTEGRVEGGWRLGAPLSVRLPVNPEAALSRTGCTVFTGAITHGEGQKDEPQVSSTVLLDLFVFAAPSMAQVAALQSLWTARDERRLRRLSALQSTEKALVASATAGCHRDEKTVDRNKALCSVTAVQLRTTTSQFSHMQTSRASYKLLRAPPSVIRVDTFAVIDGIPASPTSCVFTGSAGGKRENAPLWSCQTLWTMPRVQVMRRSRSRNTTEQAPGSIQTLGEGWLTDRPTNATVSVEMQTWVIDGQTSEVQAPVWTLLANGPPALHSDEHLRLIHSPALSLASHLHAGRALLREVQRLRLDWRSDGEGVFYQSAGPLAALAGLVGCASVSYVAANGAACLWVSGGLRRCSTESNQHMNPADSRVQGADGDRNAGHLAVRPSPPLLPSFELHKGAGRRRFQPPPSSQRAMVSGEAVVPSSTPRRGLYAVSDNSSYTLYGSHFFSCSASETATDSVWSCDVQDFTTGLLCTAPSGMRVTPRLFHTATLVRDRIWLLGGWTLPVGATTIPSLLVGLVERRRREVYRAATRGSNRDASCGRLSAEALAEGSSYCVHTCAPDGHSNTSGKPPSTVLRWCEGVQSAQCLADGSPAPPVDVPLPSTQGNSAEERGAGCGLLITPPRIACHVAVACEDRWVALFGGLVLPSGTDDDAPVATSDVHVYDTVQGTWSVQHDFKAGDRQEEWPMARYGHSVTPVPGTGCGQLPRSYFVFGGASAMPSSHSFPVSPEQLLWVWTPVADMGRPGSIGAAQGVSVHSTWRRVQLLTGLSVPLTSRFLSQLRAYSALEVANAICSTAEPLSDGSALLSDPGLTSMVLCVAGGMTAPAQSRAPAAASDSVLPTTKTTGTDAYRAFCEYVEPWFGHPASKVVSVLLTCLCERQRPVAVSTKV